MPNPLTPPVAVEVQKVEAKLTPAPPKRNKIQQEEDDSALLAKFQQDNDVPGWVDAQFRNMDSMASFVYKDAFGDNEYGIGVNYTISLLNTKLAQVFPANPQVSCEPGDMMWPDSPEGAEMARLHGRVGTTAEKLLMRLFELGEGRPVVQDAVHQALTVGISWLLVTWEEDVHRDAVGRYFDRVDDQEERARYEALYQRWKDGDIAEGSDEFSSMMELSVMLQQQLEINRLRSTSDPEDSRAARQDLMDLWEESSEPVPPSLLPQPMHWRVARFDRLPYDDVRIDWRVRTVSEWWRGDFFAYRVWMHPTDIEAKWGDGLTEEQLDMLRFTGSQSNQTTASSGDDDQNSVDERTEETDDQEVWREGKRAVWCRYDGRTGRVFVWAAGAGFFLDKYTSDLRFRKRYPAVPVYFEPVTDRFFPLGLVEQVANLQKQINNTMADDVDARLAAYPWYLVAPGLLTDSARAAIRARKPFQVVEAERAEEVGKFLNEHKGVPYNPMLYSVDPYLRAMEAIAGLSASAMGQVGEANYAAEENAANVQMGIRANRYGTMADAALSDLFSIVLAFAGIGLTERQVRELVGPGAVWPEVDREVLLRSFNLTIRASGNQKPNRHTEMQLWLQVSQVLRNLGVAPDPDFILTELFEAMGVKDSPKEAVALQPPPMPGAMGAIAAQGAGAPGGPLPPNQPMSFPTGTGVAGE